MSEDDQKWRGVLGNQRGLNETFWPGVEHDDDPEHPEDKDWAGSEPEPAAP